MSWVGWTAVIIVVGFLTYITTVITGLFKSNRDLTQEKIDEIERAREIENGVIRNNVKADNATIGSDLDKRVREKFANKDNG